MGIRLQTFMYRFGVGMAAVGGLGLLLATGNPAMAALASDTCAGAALIGDGTPADSDTTVGAAPENLGTCGTSDGTGGAVWYRVMGTGGNITVDTCSAGTDYDT